MEMYEQLDKRHAKLLRKALQAIGLDVILFDNGMDINEKTKAHLGLKTNVLSTTVECKFPTLLARSRNLYDVFNWIIGNDKCTHIFNASTYSYIENPYLECNSLDEVQVKIDLLGG